MPLPWYLRALSLLTAGGVATLLIVAGQLQPAAAGYGTHRQLGLPGCLSLSLFDTTCPACGMTTAWAWLLQGEFQRSLAANAGGCLLAIIALAYLPLSCYFLCGGSVSLRGRWCWAFGLGILSALAIATVQWSGRLLP